MINWYLTLRDDIIRGCLNYMKYRAPRTNSLLLYITISKFPPFMSMIVHFLDLGLFLLHSGVRPSGAAVLHPQMYEASITIEGGNEPHGIFSFAPTSQLRRTPEANISVPLVVDRKFGSIGEWYI